MNQGTEEWIEARLGNVTASRLSDVLASGRGGAPSASRANYCAELVIERLTSKPMDNKFTSAAMERGHEIEGQARAVYSLNTGRAVEETGYIPHPTISRFGCSPDGLVGDDGGYEGKAQNASKHMAYLNGGSVPKPYRDQILACLSCTGRKWWDFHSFHPDFPEALRSHVLRFERVETEIVAVEREVRKFLAEVDEAEAKMRALAGEGAAA